MLELVPSPEPPRRSPSETSTREGRLGPEFSGQLRQKSRPALLSRLVFLPWLRRPLPTSTLAPRRLFTANAATMDGGDAPATQLKALAVTGRSLRRRAGTPATTLPGKEEQQQRCAGQAPSSKDKSGKEEKPVESSEVAGLQTPRSNPSLVNVSDGKRRRRSGEWKSSSNIFSVLCAAPSSHAGGAWPGSAAHAMCAAACALTRGPN